MPRQAMPLTDAKVKNARPCPKEYRLSDGGGLHLLVVPKGGKYWPMKYRFGGKDMAPLAFGVYPAVSLAQAREKREAARKQLRESIDPGVVMKAQKAAKVAETKTDLRLSPVSGI